MLDWMAPARFVVRSCSLQGLSLQPGNTGRTSSLMWDQAGAIFCLFRLLLHTPAWGGTGKETSGIHEEDHSCGIAIPAKTGKLWKTCQGGKKSDCSGKFASWVSRPRGFGAASERFRGYPNQARRLPLPVPVGVQPSGAVSEDVPASGCSAAAPAFQEQWLIAHHQRSCCPAVQTTTNCKLKRLPPENRGKQPTKKPFLVFS